LTPRYTGTYIDGFHVAEHEQRNCAQLYCQNEGMEVPDFEINVLRCNNDSRTVQE